MGDVLPFKKTRPRDWHKGKTLCKSGFHKWVVINEHPFDVKHGKLLTVYRCTRCGATRTKGH